MRDKDFYEVMFDDTSIDVSKEVGLVWSIANSLRGAYTSDKYKDVIKMCIRDRACCSFNCGYATGIFPMSSAKRCFTVVLQVN